MTIRRTTLAADRDDLALLEGEARRRGISFTGLLRECVAREAAELRARSRPRFGVARSEAGAARAAHDDESAPLRERRGR